MVVLIVTADFTNDRMTLTLSDGRWLSVPLHYFPRLQRASPLQLADFELSPRGIHWNALNEDLSLQGLLAEQSLASAGLLHV